MSIRAKAHRGVNNSNIHRGVNKPAITEKRNNEGSLLPRCSDVNIRDAEDKKSDNMPPPEENKTPVTQWSPTQTEGG